MCRRYKYINNRKHPLMEPEGSTDHNYFKLLGTPPSFIKGNEEGGLKTALNCCGRGGEDDAETWSLGQNPTLQSSPRRRGPVNMEREAKRPRHDKKSAAWDWRVRVWREQERMVQARARNKKAVEAQRTREAEKKAYWAARKAMRERELGARTLRGTETLGVRTSGRRRKRTEETYGGLLVPRSLPVLVQNLASNQTKARAYLAVHGRPPPLPLHRVLFPVSSISSQFELPLQFQLPCQILI